MPRIPSPTNFQRLEGPSLDAGYPHPATARRGPIPMAFQVTSPFNNRLALMPHALVLHVNPTSFNENPTKKVERIQTRGGFVEQHWGDELTEISAEGSTGAFVNIFTGLSSIERQKTIAWDRYRDLLDLYYNNGSVYDPQGNIVLQGNVMLMYDKGTYIGYFVNFSSEETGDSPFTFNISWTFKVEETILQMPTQRGQVSGPAFQSQNTFEIPTQSQPLGQPSQPIGQPSTTVSPKAAGSSNATVKPAPTPAKISQPKANPKPAPVIQSAAPKPVVSSSQPVAPPGPIPPPSVWEATGQGTNEDGTPYTMLTDQFGHTKTRGKH